MPLSVAFFTDFTERKRIEAALSSSEKRHRTLVETADDFITEIIWGVILYASPGFYSVTGYRPADILGRTPFDLMDPPYAMPGQSASLKRKRGIGKRSWATRKPSSAKTARP